MGNERGIAGDPNWSTVDPAIVTVPGMSGRAVTDMLQHGDPAGRAWRPGEADVSIRPGWFHHPAEDSRVKTAEQLVQLYFTSVGRNAKLLLNVPPTREGVLHDVDVARLTEMRERLARLFAEDAAHGRHVTWQVTGAAEAIGTIDLGRSVPIGIIDLREPIEHGQAIARYVVEGGERGDWRVLCRGTTIGCRKLDRVDGPPIREIRVHLEGAGAAPRGVSVGVY
jgi:alpha-L-fucosidase